MKTELNKNLSDYEQQMFMMDTTRKDIEDDRATHKDEISSHKEAMDKHS
jgi:hypothetical protein